MHTFNRRLIALATALAFPCAAALAAPYPTSATPKAVDNGAFASSTQLTVTVALNLHDIEGARSLVQQMYTKGGAGYRQFLSPEQFASRFGPTDAEVAKVTAALAKYGLTVTRASTTTLHVTGSSQAMEQAFNTSLHTFNVAAKGSAPAYSFHAPISTPTVDADAAPYVHSVLGLSDRPAFFPHIKRLTDRAGALGTVKPKTTATSGGNPPGYLTVSDFASHYDVNPLYNQGITGKGATIGIVTLASFTPSDAFTYWSAVGLKNVDPKRLTVVNIDGGAGAISDADGSGETTLDVEQSGGVAPGAKMIVYIAPNTSQGFVDAFATAVDRNQVDTLSTSWGEWEWFDNLENSPVSDPYTGRQVSSLKAMDELFIQAALQGQSLFASSGDAGAYDADDGLPLPAFSLALSVDSPASDPYITAAGGTTLAGNQVYDLPNGTLTINIPHERIWSWDYLDGLCSQLGYTPITCGIFPVGSGGGVSVVYRTPIYQLGLPGVQRSQPNQSFIDGYDFSPPEDLYDLPANFPGRNVPDISANADPDTGYVIYYTSSVNGYEIETFYGGTSFVAPQMNGVTALLNQSLHGRVGLMNFPLYLLGQTFGYAGPKAPLTAIKYGNNDFYTGTNGYNPGAGLGILDVANLNQILKELF